MKEIKKIKGGIVRRLMSYIRPYRGYVAGAVVFSVLYVAFVLIGPVLYGEAIDAMIGAGQVDFSRVYGMVGGFAACVLACAAAQKLLNNCVNSLCYKLVRDLRRDAFDSLTDAGVKYIDTHAQGDVMTRIVNDVDVITDGLLQGAAQLFTGVMTILATLIVMFVVNYIIALVVVVLTPLSLFVAAAITKRTFRLFRKQVRIQGALVAHTKEMFGGQKSVILFNEEEYSEKKFEGIKALTNPSTRFVNAVISAFVGTLGVIFCIMSDGGVLTLGGVTLGAFTVGKLSVFLSYANQYTKPFNEISNVVTQLQNAFASAARVFEVVDEPGENKAGEPVCGKCRGDIAFEDVWFSYDAQKPLIEGLDIRVKAGSKIAIVGPTGCGKTTLINLLMRFYAPDKGRITVDGRDVACIPLDEYRKMFGMVLQESFLAGETVAYNIAYGAEHASREEIGGDRAGGKGGVLRLFHRQPRTGLRHRAHGQCEYFTGGKTAPVHRARHARGSSHAYPRRGDEQYRYDDRNAYPEGVPQDHARQDELCGGAQAFHRARRGPHPRHGPRLRHRAGHARAAHAKGRILFPPLQRAVREGGTGAERGRLSPLLRQNIPLLRKKDGGAADCRAPCLSFLRPPFAFAVDEHGRPLVFEGHEVFVVLFVRQCPDFVLFVLRHERPPCVCQS